MVRRACIVRQGPYPQDLLFRREAETLRDDGFEVDVICQHRPRAEVEEMIDGIHVHRLPVERRKGSVIRYIYAYALFFLLAALKLTRLHLQRPFSVIQVNTMPDFLVFATAVPRLMGAKVTLVMYEPMPELWATLYNRRSVIESLEIIQQLAIRYAHAVFVVTRQQKDTLVNRGAAADKISVILNAPETRFWEKPAPRNGAVREHFTLICHGAIEERYGHDTMLQAVQRVKDSVPNVRLRILGRGSRSDELQAQIKAMGLEPWVRFLGFVPLAQMVAEIAHADVGIVAQKSSPYSNLVHTGKMYDYLSFGVPVLASRLRAVEAYFDDDSLYFFEPGDAESLAKGILDLYQHPTKRRSLVNNSRGLYTQYRWQEQREIYLSIYRTLLK